jgi:hypothetical protein
LRRQAPPSPVSVTSSAVVPFGGAVTYPAVAHSAPQVAVASAGEPRRPSRPTGRYTARQRWTLRCV